jgi:hypothetical protein
VLRFRSPWLFVDTLASRLVWCFSFSVACSGTTVVCFVGESFTYVARDNQAGRLSFPPLFEESCLLRMRRQHDNRMRGKRPPHGGKRSRLLDRFALCQQVGLYCAIVHPYVIGLIFTQTALDTAVPKPNIPTDPRRSNCPPHCFPSSTERSHTNQHTKLAHTDRP